MVIICPNDSFFENDKYSIHFQEFPYELSNFQKWAIKAIVDGDHSLVTAHTGSGKTLPAEFAIKYFVKQGKKIIYASPLKALSNQKLYDFRRKFPDISFGILTGDIKDNPDVLELGRADFFKEDEDGDEAAFQSLIAKGE